MLTPLAALRAADVPPGTKFSFDDPAGPQFTEKQKQSQREAGTRIVPMVTDAWRSGAASVRIPAGDYRFGKERWDRNGVIYALEFADLQRDAGHPLAINAEGATFWFDLGDDQAPTSHFCIGFKNCRHILFQGATIDRGTRGHIEGRITQLDFAHNRIEIALSPGVTVPEKFSFGLEQRVLPFKADGRFCAPLYALQLGGVHLKYASITPGRARGRCYVNLGDTALLDTIRDPQWQQAYGDLGTLGVGDGLSCVYTVAAALELVHCGQMTMEDLRVYVAKGWGAEFGGDGGHLWRNCYFGPRPGTSQWQGGEGFMFNATRRGTTLDNVTILHTTDDTANFHGYWGHIKRVAGNRVTLEMSGEFRRTLALDARAGDQLLFLDKNTGEVLGNATVEAVEGDTVTLDRTASDFANAIVEWLDHECAGWLIENCHWHDNCQRLLIQTGPGTVRHCTFTRQGNGLELNCDMPYVEGGRPRGITIEDNCFSDVNPSSPNGIVGVHLHTFGKRQAALIENLRIAGNTFTRPRAVAILDGQVAAARGRVKCLPAIRKFSIRAACRCRRCADEHRRYRGSRR